jgi:hypothetical protein
MKQLTIIVFLSIVWKHVITINCEAGIMSGLSGLILSYLIGLNFQIYIL